jgi:plastocyanin
VVHAKVRDQVLDDGVDHLTARARSVALATPVSVNVTLTPAGFSPAASNVAPGTSVVFANASGSTQTLQGTSAPWTWSVTLADGQLYEHFFVAAGSYGVSASPSGAGATVTVSGGGVDTTPGLKAGVSQYRFALPNPLGAGGARLVYELELDDWAGNRTVTTNGVVALVDCGLATYCTSRPSSLPGCVPAVDATGTPSASAGSGFTVRATPVLGAKVGLFVYTTQGAAQSPLSLPYGSLCIATGGVRRIAAQSSGGTPGACDGQLAVDFNQHFASQTKDPTLVPGARVDLQAWYRDPANPGGANLTEAGTFYMCP